ncbi:MAG TPA: hypothetical protein PK018_06960 [Candidatus Competibacter sp.]|nr:hypothetical protein [Candidatus Competibacteraceae bacterium]HPE71896.1 hypothetical protein [Candidatus Competibacter sp.]HRW66114.1 hypothetical protein [Candidatus Competibacter sp.]
MKPVKADFDILVASISDLRGTRAKLEADRCAIGARMREVLEAPPDKGVLKGMMRRVIEGFSEVWNRPLIERLECLKTGITPDEFVNRHVSVARNTEFVQDNGWFCLLAPAMLHSVDHFIDRLDWPDGLSDEERAARLAKLQAELDANVAKMTAIDEQFSQMGVHPIRPDKAVV